MKAHSGAETAANTALWLSFPKGSGPVLMPRCMYAGLVISVVLGSGVPPVVFLLTWRGCTGALNFGLRANLPVLLFIVLMDCGGHGRALVCRLQ